MSNKKRNVVIVDAYPGGINHIRDLRRRNLHPVILYSKDVGDVYIQLRKVAKEDFGDDVTFIIEKNTYKETLAEIKKYKPLALFHCSDIGAPLAMRLANDLKLLTSPMSRLNAFTSKQAMHLALKKAGLRYIRGESANSEEEAIKVYKKLKFKKVVIKPVVGAGSECVKICKNFDEFKKKIKVFFKSSTDGIVNTRVLIQEMIDVHNNEYIVNTMSINGKARLVSVWKYEMDFTDKGVIFASVHNVKDYKKYKDLIDYALKTVDAIGMVNGMVHGEYFIDKKGPILIEVNCRIMGGITADGYSDTLYGYHDTEELLDDLLFPEQFKNKTKDYFNNYRLGNCKHILIPRDIDIISYPCVSLLTRVQSYYYLKELKPQHALETVDYDTIIGNIYLTHSNDEITQKETDLLNHIEAKYFKLWVESKQEEKEIKHPYKKTCWNAKQLLNKLYPLGSTIYLVDKEMEIPYVTSKNLTNVKDCIDGFKFGIISYDFSKYKKNRQQLIKELFNFFLKIRIHGHLFVPFESVAYFPYGMQGMKLISEVFGFKCKIDPIKGLIGERIR